MSTTTVSRIAPRALASRPVVDVIVERLALRLLAWSERRALITHPTAAELARMRSDAHVSRAREEHIARAWASSPRRR